MRPRWNPSISASGEYEDAPPRRHERNSFAKRVGAVAWCHRGVRCVVAVEIPFCTPLMITTLIFLSVLLLLTLGVAAYETYGERKVAAFMQDRIGPDRAGPFGILQPLADGVKMFMKEDFV